MSLEALLKPNRENNFGRIGRPGLTLIEVVTATAVLGLLLAILLPAISAVRAMARMTTCASNLHQLGLALDGVEASHGYYPTAQQPVPAMWPLLPHLDQKSLYEALTTQGAPSPLPAVDVFLCPDDGIAWGQSSMGELSYYFNDGSVFRRSEMNGYRKSPRVNTAPSEISDGLSNTAAVSERLVRRLDFKTPLHHEELAKDVGRYFWNTPRSFTRDGDELAAAEMCISGRTFPSAVYGSNGNQFRPTLFGYDHILPPGSHACYNAPEGYESLAYILAPASSLHSNGVNVLMADGRVTLRSFQLDANVWRSLGSRSGEE